MKGCLQRIEEQRQLQAVTGKPLSTSRSKAKGAGAKALSVKRMCALAKVSRVGFYRGRHDECTLDRDLKLREAIQRIALEFPSYGWPRMTEELQRRGWAVNHKRVYRLMREDNLLCLRRRKFVVTTDSNHSLPVYPNLAREMTLTSLDQLWVADHEPATATCKDGRSACWRKDI